MKLSYGAYFIGLVAILAIIIRVYYVYARIKAAGWKALRKKFKSLGDLKGKGLSEIVAVVGNYDSMKVVRTENEYTWHKRGYFMCLHFNKKGICTSIVREFIKKR